MLLLELLSRLQNSNTSLLFWNLFTGLKFLNELNIKSSLSQILNTTQPSYLYDLIYSASSRSQHTLFALYHSHQTIIITQGHSSILPTCFTSSLEPASYITQNSSSKLLIPLSATFIWKTCRFNLLHSAITFHHCFTLSSKHWRIQGAIRPCPLSWFFACFAGDY